MKIRTVLKKILTLRNFPTKVKTQTDRINTKGVLYSVACKCGRVYADEMVRTLKQRITEHIQTVKNADSNNGIAVHVWL